MAACTTIGTVNGSIFPFIIFYALTFVLSYSFFTFEHEAPPSSTLFFLLKNTSQKVRCNLFSIFSVVYISLVILTVGDGFCGFSF
jgi:hypothetical protein